MARDPNRIFSPKDVTSKARVLSKPEPQYTEEARKNQVTGTVILRAVFSSTGQVTNISARAGLPYGLTERAIARCASNQIHSSYQGWPSGFDVHPTGIQLQPLLRTTLNEERAPIDSVGALFVCCRAISCS